MPVGIPKAGFRRTKKYWDQATKQEQLAAIESDIASDLPRIVKELEKLTKAFPCPHCGNEIKTIDKDVGIYLMNRVMGMPRQRQEISQEVVFSADQIESIIQRLCNENERFRIAYESYLALPEPKE